MKTRLGQLTLSEFVSLVTGDVKVLLGKREIASPSKIALVARGIVLEFQAIADPAGQNSFFRHIEEWISAQTDFNVFSMCDILIAAKQFDSARQILISCGISAEGWTDGRLGGIVQAKLAQCHRKIEELESESDEMRVEKEKIRSGIDSQIASMMAHFKFQIDPATIKATLYAHLVARYNREMKAQMAALKKK